MDKIIIMLDEEGQMVKDGIKLDEAIASN